MWFIAACAFEFITYEPTIYNATVLFTIFELIFYLALQLSVLINFTWEITHKVYKSMIFPPFSVQWFFYFRLNVGARRICQLLLLFRPDLSRPIMVETCPMSNIWPKQEYSIDFLLRHLSVQKRDSFVSNSLCLLMSVPWKHFISRNNFVSDL